MAFTTEVDGAMDMTLVEDGSGDGPTEDGSGLADDGSKKGLGKLLQPPRTPGSTRRMRATAIPARERHFLLQDASFAILETGSRRPAAVTTPASRNSFSQQASIRLVEPPP